MVTFSRKEVVHLLIAAVILGLLFGYDDNQPTFNLSFWIINVIVMVLLSFLSIVMYDMGHKIVAKKLGCASEFQLWIGKRLSLASGARMRRGIPFGVIIPLVLLFLTKGMLKFAAVSTITMTTSSAKRLSREFPKLSEFDEARIALSGPVTALIIALVTKAISPTIPAISALTTISIHLALFNMLPIPTLDGLKVYFGSPLLYSFFFVIIMATFFLIKFISPLAAILLSILAAIIAFFVHYNIGFVKAK